VGQSVDTAEEVVIFGSVFKHMDAPHQKKRKHAVAAAASVASEEVSVSVSLDDEGLSGYEHMHPRSVYFRRPPDFAALAVAYPWFGAHVIETRGGHCTLDWRQSASVLALTRVLLLHDFGLQFDMPLHNLCPPVPQRLNYLLWIEDLLWLMRLSPMQYQLRGLDIGTGASAIFPLLGVTRNFNFVYVYQGLKWRHPAFAIHHQFFFI
jgi:hypothetical protein